MNKKESRRSFMKKSAGAIATGLVMPGNLFPLSLQEEDIDNHSSKLALENDSPTMMSGFAEIDVTPEFGMEQPGGYGKSFHKTLHDPCKVRAVVFKDGKQRVALVGIDALMIDRSFVLSVREKVEKRCGILAESILISATHSHSSGPTGMVQPGQYDHASNFVKTLAYEKSSAADPKYLASLEKKMVDVICQANDSLDESVLGVGVGIEDNVAFNRRFRMKNGLTYTHPRPGNPDIVKPAGPVDPEVGVIGVWNKEGKCTGCIVNFACHATTNPGGISANWIYYLEQTIRGAMGDDCVVIFLPGASGDITQVDNLSPYKNLAGEDWARFVGAQVGAEAVKVLLSMPRGVMLPIDTRSEVLKIKRRVPNPKRVAESVEIVKKSPSEVGSTEWAFAKEIVLLDAIIKKEPTDQVEVQTIQVGPAIFITNPAEFFCEYGLDIKNQSPFAFTFPVSLTNGCVGYVPTEEAFGPYGGGYETRLTSYSNLEIKAGRKMVQTGVKLANQMKPGSMPEFEGALPFNDNAWAYGNVKPELE